MAAHPPGQPSQMARLDRLAILALLAVPVLFAVLLLACDGHEATAPGPSLSGAGNGPNGKNATIRVMPGSDTLDALYDTLLLTSNAEVTWSSLTPTVQAWTHSAELFLSVPGPGSFRLSESGVGKPIPPRS